MKISTLVIFLAILTLGAYGLSTTFKNNDLSLNSKINLDSGFAYNNHDFILGVSSINQEITEKPKMLIVPHHLLASPLIAKGIKSLKNISGLKKIIILSPDHNNNGLCDIQTSSSDWDTPYGVVKINQPAQKVLLASGSVCEDRNELASEHGIAGLLPFIRYYLPDVDVIPLAFKKTVDTKKLNTLASNLEKTMQSQDTVLISSLDFSHNLSLQKSQQMDEVTLQAIKALDYDKILSFSSDNLDSPASLYMVLRLSELLNIRLNLIDHTNSSVFNRDQSLVTSYFLLQASQKDTSAVSILAAGDVMLGRTVNTRIQKYNDVQWPFLKTADFLKSADITMINLESPFKSGCQPTDKGMVFCASPSSVQGLLYSGVDVANIANNHIDNQGVEGVEETIKTLESSGISAIGHGNIYSKTLKNIRIAIVGFNDIGPSRFGISSASETNVKSEISTAAAVSDVVVATFHWGNEYSATSERQRELAKLAVDSGADVVIGHHPHWVQSIETYKNKHIFYSLGNFVFDQMWSKETSSGLVVELKIKSKNDISYTLHPINILNFGQPELISLN